MKKHLLFICSSNVDRSPAAEALFEDNERCEAKSAGVGAFCDEDRKVTKEIVDWADVIFVMDERREQHKTALLKQFPEAEAKDIRILNISNEFARHDPELERRMKIALEGEGFL